MSARRKGPMGRRISKNQHVTKSGNVFKIHRNLTERWVARKDAAVRRRAERLATLPKSRFKRFLYHFKPSRMYRYWFSRDGGIMALKIAGIGFVVGFVLLLGVFAYFRKDLPDITSVSKGNIGGSIRYYDRTGQTLLWEDYDAVKRIPVKTSEISQYVRDATVAVEDKDFFKHGGFDVRGIMRAGINDVFKHGSTQGGSTITQQLIKLNLDWTQQRTMTRKIKELILSVELEREYSKQDILTGYLNTAPYGNIEYGVEAATRDYFHKSSKDLTLDEAAFLAAIPKSPSIYSPYGPYFDSKELLGRQRYILDQMSNLHMITKDKAEAAKKVNVLKKIHKQETKYAGIKSPYFALAAKAQLERDFTAAVVKRGGWKVTTTMDTKLQDIAEKTVANNTANALSHGADEQALVAEDVKTGQMVALVGGTDFSNPTHGKINYARWNISPGSSFKPYDYTTLIENSTNAGAGSVLYDSQGAIPGYLCTIKGSPPPRGNSNCLQDYDFRNPGPVTLRYALGGSRNIPAVKAMLIAGTDKVINTADDMMVSPGAYKCYKPGADVNTATKADEAQCYGSSAIGDGAYLHLDNHVNGLATLGRLGNAIKATYILKIQDVSNKTVYEWKQPPVNQVIRPDTAYIVNDMASDPNASYLRAGYAKWHRYNGWQTAIKTGTTNNGFDGLMMAWNTQYAVGSWIGYHTRNVTLRGFMEQSTTPLTRGFMTAALDRIKTKPVNWQRPSGVKTAPAFVVRSHVGLGSVEPSPSSDIYPSWYQGTSKQANANKPIDIISNKLATDCTPNLARKSSSNSNSIIFSIDIFVDKIGAGANTKQTDDVHNCGDTRPNVSFSLVPPACTSGASCTVYIDVTKGTHALSSDKYKGTVNLSIGGKTVKSITVNNSASSVPIKFSYSGSGSKKITAQIIDSVLYDSSDSATMSFNSPAASLSISSPSDGDPGVGGSVVVSWTGGTGPYSVNTKKLGDSWVSQCTGVTSPLSCAISLSGPPGTEYSIKVEDSASNSDTITVTK